MANKISTRTITGLYVVMPSRALHWPAKDGKPAIWARAGEVVDLTSRYLAEIANMTGQMHKLKAVDEAPAGAVVIGRDQLPADVRVRMDRFEAGQPAESGDLNIREPQREIDLDALPSAAPSDAERAKEMVDGVFAALEELEEKPKPAKKTRRKAKAPESPAAGSESEEG